MCEKISGGTFWIISIFFCVFALTQIVPDPEIVDILYLPLGVLICPKTLDFMFKKLGIAKVDYKYFARILLTFGGMLLAYILTICIVLCTNIAKDANTASDNVVSIMKLIMYIIYIIVVFANRKKQKESKYKFFGIYYFLCIIFSYASPSIYRPIMSFLSLFSTGGFDESFWHLLMDCFLDPIKEAILTYIIFDTVIISSRKKRTDKSDLKYSLRDITIVNQDSEEVK